MTHAKAHAPRQPYFVFVLLFRAKTLAHIQAPLDGPGRHAHRLAAYGRLDGFEVPVLDRAGAYERFNLGEDLGFERRFEPIDAERATFDA